jgi:hypothetical protein
VKVRATVRVSEAAATLGRMPPRSMPRNRRVAGIVTTAELIAAGWRDDQIGAGVKRGDLMAIRRGVYADGARGRKLLTFRDGEQLLAAAGASALAGLGAVVSHQSAAYLHKIALLGRPDPAVHLTRPPGAGWRGATGIRLHSAALPSQHVTTHLEMSLTTAARTVVDLARTLPFRAGVVAADSALHQRLATKDDLLAVLDSCTVAGHLGRRGRHRIRRRAKRVTARVHRQSRLPGRRPPAPDVAGPDWDRGGRGPG